MVSEVLVHDWLAFSLRACGGSASHMVDKASSLQGHQDAKDRTKGQGANVWFKATALVTSLLSSGFPS